MSLTVDLRPEIEARLSAVAAARGMSLAQFASHVLEAQLPEENPLSLAERAALWLELAMNAPPAKPLSPAERAKLWRESVRNLPPSEPLSDEAISRESMYEERG
jgi:hypothetical protein